MAQPRGRTFWADLKTRAQNGQVKVLFFTLLHMAAMYTGSSTTFKEMLIYFGRSREQPANNGRLFFLEEALEPLIPSSLGAAELIETMSEVAWQATIKVLLCVGQLAALLVAVPTLTINFQMTYRVYACLPEHVQDFVSRLPFVVLYYHHDYFLYIKGELAQVNAIRFNVTVSKQDEGRLERLLAGSKERFERRKERLEAARDEELERDKEEIAKLCDTIYSKAGSKLTQLELERPAVAIIDIRYLRAAADELGVDNAASAIHILKWAVTAKHKPGVGAIRLRFVEHLSFALGIPCKSCGSDLGGSTMYAYRDGSGYLCLKCLCKGCMQRQNLLQKISILGDAGKDYIRRAAAAAKLVISPLLFNRLVQSGAGIKSGESAAGKFAKRQKK